MDIDPTQLRIHAMREGYESFYLKAHHPSEPLGVWIRYTSLKQPDGTVTTSAWCTLFTAEGPVASKVNRATTPAHGDGDWIRFPGARLGPGVAIGDASTPGNAASWELGFRTSEPPLHHLPKRWMYRRALPKTKPITVVPSGIFDGTLSIGGRSVAVEGWRGMLGHNWGSEHAERWIWLHGVGFDGHGDATWLDAVIGRIKLGPATTPWIGNGALSIGGVRHRLGGIERARSTEVRERTDGAEIVLPSKDGRARITLSAPQDRFVGWRYAHPDGSEHHVVNCSIADALVEATIGDRTETLKVAGGAAYELGAREASSAVTEQPFGEELA